MIEFFQRVKVIGVNQHRTYLRDQAGGKEVAPLVLMTIYDYYNQSKD
jgi:hypothetical protein